MFDYSQLQEDLDQDLGLSSLGINAETVPLSSDMDIATVRRVMLSRSFFKKLCPTGRPDESLIAASQEKFRETNESIPSEPFHWHAETEIDAVFWDFFRNHFDSAIETCVHEFEFQQLALALEVGPGSSVGAHSESAYNKLYSSALTYTDPYLLALYRAAVCMSETSQRAEKLRDDNFGHRMVPGNRLFFVNKNNTSLRTCCTEPALNMLFQQAIRKGLELCLIRYFGLDISVQAKNNRRLAQEGSRTGEFCTLDLTEASDCNSWALIQRIARGRFLSLLRMSRSPNTVFPDGTVVPLNMISTMGNGFTFPLMTLIFACTVRSVYEMMGLSSSSPETDFCVFGDDIIVRREAYSTVVRMLQKLGYRVNEAKSFAVGPFRESCGGDYFAGEPVRGVYIKTLESDASIYSALNRLIRWSSTTGIPLPRVLNRLRRALRGEPLLVPRYESDNAGLHVPESVALSRGKRVSFDASSGVWTYSLVKPQPCDWTVPLSEDEFRKLQAKAKGLRRGLYRFWNPYGVECLILSNRAGRIEKPIILRPSCPEEAGTGPGTLPFKSGWRPLGGLVRYKVSRTQSHLWWDWSGSHEGRLPTSLVSDAAWESIVSGLV